MHHVCTVAFFRLINPVVRFYPSDSHKWDGLHTRHLLESVHTQTHTPRGRLEAHRPQHPAAIATTQAASRLQPLYYVFLPLPPLLSGFACRSPGVGRRWTALSLLEEQPLLLVQAAELLEGQRDPDRHHPLQLPAIGLKPQQILQIALAQRLVRPVDRGELLVSSWQVLCAAGGRGVGRGRACRASERAHPCPHRVSADRSLPPCPQIASARSSSGPAASEAHSSPPGRARTQARKRPPVREGARVGGRSCGDG